MGEPNAEVADDSGRPDMVEITLDNRTHSVPKDAADTLKAKEHDLASRNERILTEEREKNAAIIEAEKAKVQNDLADDIDWFNSHPDQRDWTYYSRKIEGGDGSFNKPAEDITMVQNTVKSPFINDPQIDKLQKELNTVKSTLEGNAVLTEQRACQEVTLARDEILPQCVYVDEEIATALLNSFLTTNHRHPNKTEIISIIKNKETRMADISNKKTEATVSAKLNPISAMPVPGGLSPLPPDTVLPAQGDKEGWAKLARDNNVQWGGTY